MQDIADSVNAGLVVTTSQTSIDYSGHATSGYIIMDPATGAAAYKISTGADGAFIAIFLVVVLIVIAIAIFAPELLPLLLEISNFLAKANDVINIVLKTIEAFKTCSFGTALALHVAYSVIWAILDIAADSFFDALPESLKVEMRKSLKAYFGVILGFGADKGEEAGHDYLCG